MITRNAFLILITIPAFVHSQSNWILRKEKNGILVYSLKTDTSSFNSIKVETEMQGRLEDLVATIMNVENHYRWAYGTKSATILKRISKTEIIFYKEIASPSPASNRDIVMQLKVRQANNTVRVEGVALPDFIPRKEGLVRVLVSNETWFITKLDERKIKIQYFLQIDPGGALPAFLVNLFAIKGPYESFENLKGILQR